MPDRHQNKLTATPGSVEPRTPLTARSGFRAYRNGLPVTPGYQWRARRYPQAEQALQAAEAQYGPPRSTCYCGQPVVISQGRVRRCGACGRAPGEQQ